MKWYIQVLGYIWQPGIGLCSYVYWPGDTTLQPPLEDKTREGVAVWLKKNAGDFERIEDFCVRKSDGEVIFPWVTESNECVFIETIEQGW